MVVPKQILNLLCQLNSDERRLPATVIYNEGWMLRLVLDAGSRGLLPSYMENRSFWFSEIQLRTPFGRARGPKFESNTHADGVVGDFRVDADTRSGLDLSNSANSFLVFEAKMYSPLSGGTRHAPGFDQAARTVACMAYALQSAGRHPKDVKRLGFYVVAPQQQISGSIFDLQMTAESIRARIEDRIRDFSGIVRNHLEIWRDDWAWPLLDELANNQSLECVAWEYLIQEVARSDPDEGETIRSFYEKCKQYNLPIARRTEACGRPVRGKEYMVRGGRRAGQRVRVCSCGNTNSRVYATSERDDAFLVPNEGLEPIRDTDQTPAPPDPVVGYEYWWTRLGEEAVQVRILNIGECNSRVMRSDGTGESLKVPNHQLCPVNT